VTRAPLPMRDPWSPHIECPLPGPDKGAGCPQRRRALTCAGVALQHVCDARWCKICWARLSNKQKAFSRTDAPQLAAISRPSRCSHALPSDDCSAPTRRSLRGLFYCRTLPLAFLDWAGPPRAGFELDSIDYDSSCIFNDRFENHPRLSYSRCLSARVAENFPRALGRRGDVDRCQVFFLRHFTAGWQGLARAILGR